MIMVQSCDFTDVSSVIDNPAWGDEDQKARLRAVDASSHATAGAKGKSQAIWSIQVVGNKRGGRRKLGSDTTQGS